MFLVLVLIFSLVILWYKSKHLKKIFQIIAILFFATSAFAQVVVPPDTTKAIIKPSKPAYETLEVPPFNLILVNDSSKFSKINLQKKKKTLVIVFSPSCDHCKHAVEEMTSNYAKFKNINIVMATVTKYEYTKKFYDEYSLQNFPNIIVGIDSDYFLGRFYEIRTYPSIFLYDKKGNFKKFYNSSFTMLNIAKDL